MATTNRTRSVQANQVVFDQVEILQADLFTRVLGLVVADVVLTLTYNNIAVSWPLVSGTGTTDAQIASGSVYWDELPSGAYGLRFFPNALGMWSVEIAYSTGALNQRVTVTYDVFNPFPIEDELRVSF
jgi:hypothetical protein